MSHDHIEENLLERYAMGALAEEPRAALDEHLLSCQDCQARLIQVDAFLAAFGPAVRQIQEQPVAAPGKFLLLPKLVWPASIAVMAACLLFLVLRPGLHPAAPAIIQMQALRGPERAAVVTEGQAAVLVFDVSGQVQRAEYDVEVVDLSGSAVFTVRTKAKRESLDIPVPKLEAGAYWVRVYRDPSNRQLLAEYALRVAKPSRFKSN